MRDETVYLWAQWGVLNFDLYEKIKTVFGDLETAWKKITPDFFRRVGFGHEKSMRLFAIREALSLHDINRQMERVSARILFIEDEAYPFYLKNIAQPPPFLFVRGGLPSFEKSLAVVGTRRMTDYGRAMTEKFTRELVENDFTIVSGLALGVDACAHETTLKQGGKTVAVLGCGVDRFYPSSNHRLAQNILEQGGAIVSSYSLGTPPMPHHFPERNVIISGLSRGTLVVEGGVGSGALITAKEALDQGREVFAVPGSLSKTALSGTNHLIRRSEAKLVEKVDHVLEEFNLSPVTVTRKFVSDGPQKILLSLLATGGETVNDLARKSSFSVVSLLTFLTQLSLQGVVREEGDKWVLN